jgi:hypothetical protein
VTPSAPRPSLVSSARACSDNGIGVGGGGGCAAAITKDVAGPNANASPVMGASSSATISGASGAAGGGDALNSVGSPFENVCLKHIRRSLHAFESYYLQMVRDKHVRLTKARQNFAKIAADPSVTPHYDLLTSRHAEQIAAINQRFQHAVDVVVQQYDAYMTAHGNPSTFLLPIFVTINVENRDITCEVAVRLTDSVADLREALIDHTTKSGDPIAEFGPLSYFTLRRAADR